LHPKIFLLILSPIHIQTNLKQPPPPRMRHFRRHLQSYVLSELNQRVPHYSWILQSLLLRTTEGLNDTLKTQLPMTNKTK
jgi:hypothetical protein